MTERLQAGVKPAGKQAWREGDRQEALRIIAEEHNLDLSNPQDALRADTLLGALDPSAVDWISPSTALRSREKARVRAAIQEAEKLNAFEREQARLTQAKRDKELTAKAIAAGKRVRAAPRRDSVESRFRAESRRSERAGHGEAGNV